MDSGLVATFIEAPLDIQRSVMIPEDHLQACNASGIMTAGNAAGNTEDLYNLIGENRAPPPLPEGFTPGGIVALVFSCIAAILGIISVVWSVLMPMRPLNMDSRLVINCFSACQRTLSLTDHRYGMAPITTQMPTTRPLEQAEEVGK